MVACCSINMRIFKTVEFILILASIVLSIDASTMRKINNDFSRLTNDTPAIIDEKPEIGGDHYDQRQNGTENYRIHVDGLILVVAPIEGLLLAGGIPGVGDSSIFGTSQQNEQPLSINEKPKPDATTTTTTAEVKPNEEKPSSGKSSQGTGLRLMNLLSPFLRRVHQQQ